MYLEDLRNPAGVARLKRNIVAPSARQRRLGRQQDLDLHMETLRQGFVGAPELCVAHAELIVRLRRRIDVATTKQLFFDLWTNETAFLCGRLNSRWLMSACDTFADFGTPLQRGQALTICAMINTVKLAETERRLARDERPDPTKTAALVEQRRKGRLERLWDGIAPYDLFGGDMPCRLFARITSSADTDPVLGPITRTLLARAAEGPNLLSRLARLNDRFWQDHA